MLSNHKVHRGSFGIKFLVRPRFVKSKSQEFFYTSSLHLPELALTVHSLLDFRVANHHTIRKQKHSYEARKVFRPENWSSYRLKLQNYPELGWSMTWPSMATNCKVPALQVDSQFWIFPRCGSRWLLPSEELRRNTLFATPSLTEAPRKSSRSQAGCSRGHSRGQLKYIHSEASTGSILGYFLDSLDTQTSSAIKIFFSYALSSATSAKQINSNSGGGVGGPAKHSG